MSNAPAKKYRVGYVSVNVWKNNGAERPFYTVDVSRSFKGDDGKLQNTPSLGHADALVAAHLLQRASDWIMEQ